MKNVFYYPPILFFKSFGLVLILFSGTCCTDEMDPEEALIGRWKLVRGETVFYEPRTVDYSSNDIVYHFHPNGSLTISSDLEDLIAYPDGQYVYEFNPKPVHTGSDLKYSLKIDGVNWPCDISGRNMILDDSPLDGPILSFVKL